jgi:hypothetical protein
MIFIVSPSTNFDYDFTSFYDHRLSNIEKMFHLYMQNKIKTFEIYKTNEKNILYQTNICPKSYYNVGQNLVKFGYMQRVKFDNKNFIFCFLKSLSEEEVNIEINNYFRLASYKELSKTAKYPTKKYGTNTKRKRQELQRLQAIYQNRKNN